MKLLKLLSSQNLNIQNIILKTGPIQKGLKIRNFFEDSPDCIIVPCYEDSLSEKKDIIMRFFNNENIKINPEDTELILSSLLSNERFSLNNELNKLILYIKTTKKNVIDALSILTDNSSQDLNNLIYLLAARKKKDFLE